MARATKEEIYDQLTSRILEKMASNVIPWRKPWKELKASGQTPRNIRGRAYRGYNWFFLLMQGFEEPVFLTFNQAKALGGTVKKGEHGFPICFWTILEKEKDGELEKIPLLRTYTVFNVEQCEGLNRKVEVPESEEFDPLEAAENIWEKMPNPPTLIHRGNQAGYVLETDRILMPLRRTFKSAEGYYETLFHEMGHSTGSPDRLNRKELGGYKPGDYSLEELTAELTSAFLCAEAGISSTTLDNQVSFLKNWMKALQNDPKMFVLASGKAQKAADYILSTKFEEEE